MVPAGEMPMLGGGMMPMAWMRMHDQTWIGAASSFMGMWIVMMIVMMLPSLVPMLRRYQRIVAGEKASLIGWRMLLVGTGYFTVWTALGIVVYPFGAALAAVEMQSALVARAIPTAAGVIVLLAGLLQFTSWKSRELACCRKGLPCNRDCQGRDCASSARTAFRHGLNLGLHCCYCCAGLTAFMLVMGVMDLGVMAAVAVGITAERLAPAGERVARAIGSVFVGAGLLLIVRAVAN